MRAYKLRAVGATSDLCWAFATSLCVVVGDFNVAPEDVAATKMLEKMPAVLLASLEKSLENPMDFGVQHKA